MGANALFQNTSGNDNVALGSGAGTNLTAGSNNVEIANAGVAGESGKIRIGTAGKQNAAFLAGVSGVSVGGSTQPVVINAAGKLGTATTRAAEPLEATVRRLVDQVKQQQGQIDRLREQLRRGG